MFFNTLWGRIRVGIKHLRPGSLDMWGIVVGLLAVVCAYTGAFSPLGIVVILGVLSGLIHHKEESGEGTRRDTECDGFVFALAVMFSGILVFAVAVMTYTFVTFYAGLPLPRNFRIF